MDHQYPTVAKIPVLDAGKFEQWLFRIQQYLQHEHYALWEVIEFGDSYVVPSNTTDTTGGDKSGRTLTLTAEDMQRKKNDVKARTTLLLSLPDEHQLQFTKYKTARELWAAILKTFGGNEATKKTKKNLLKQQYGNFKAKGSKTLEQTFNRLQVIVGQLQFMDVEIEKDDLDQKFLTSLTPEWLMHTIVWRNRSDLDTMSLDDLYNHLKVECFNCHKMGHFAREYMAPRSQNRGRRDNFRQESKAEEQAPKALMAIDRVGWDWSYMANDEEDYALVANEVAPTEFALMANISVEKKNKEGLGYTAVPPPTTQLYLSPKKDLSWIGLPECADDTITDYSRPSPTVKSISEDDQNKNTSIFETVASPITSKPFIKFVRPKDSQSDSKTYKKETPKKPPVKYAEQYIKPNMNPKARGNQRNWNNLKSQQLGPDFVIKKKTCFNCVRSPSRALWVPTVNRNYSPVNRKFSTGSRNFPTANRKFPTASRKFPTGSTKSITTDMGLKEKAGRSQKKIDDKGYWDIGCSRHMTGNISYLSDFEPYDGGYVSFGQGGCKITGKGTIKTGKLEFENVYFVKDLKYNLFSVSQICDNKNSVLFTDSECLVLGRDFKLLDDANILLKTPRQYNMYSIDLNNIVPHRDLTCLVAKASADECMLWHRRL
nr:ribonuclease H-like domain-containing protein [Tanacetum cinerariifolium]